MNRRSLLKLAATNSLGIALTPHLAGAQTTRKVRVGMIGTAHSHASGKLAAVRRMTDLCEVVGVAEPDEARRRSLASRREYADLPVLTEAQLLNHPGLDAVLVEGAVKEQAVMALQVARAGFHIHLEKPGGSSLEQFAQVVQTCRDKKRIIQIGYMFRGNPAFEFLFKAVREGWLGDIFEVNGIMGKVAGAGERKEMSQFPGGTMFELGCHLIDAMVTLLGKPGKVFPFLMRMKADDPLADNCIAVFEYDKAVATIRSCAVDVEGGARRQFTVCGTRGAVSILPLEPPKLILTLAEPRGDMRKGAQSIELRKMPGRYDDQLERFARMIRQELPLDYSHDHELVVFETVLAASGMK